MHHDQQNEEPQIQEVGAAEMQHMEEEPQQEQLLNDFNDKGGELNREDNGAAHEQQ